MKALSRLCIFLIIQNINISYGKNLNEIFNLTYQTLSKLALRHVLYYSRNIKCSNYNNNSSICLVNGSLYKTVGEDYHCLLFNISGYSDSYYYELSTYNDSRNEIKFIITHFINQNELIFQYYELNIIDDSIYNNELHYYNESLHPLNKGINCHIKDDKFRFFCFYLNKDKDVI